MKRTSQKEVEAKVASCRSSGSTQRAFCEQEGIKLPNFSYWFRRVIGDNSASGGFVEITSRPVTAEGLEVFSPRGVNCTGNPGSVGFGATTAQARCFH